MVRCFQIIINIDHKNPQKICAHCTPPRRKGQEKGHFIDTRRAKQKFLGHAAQIFLFLITWPFDEP
jgi:hypothetical protein